MQKIWLSSKLYQLLPFFYLLSGLLMLNRFANEPLGLISGLMLCAAAVLIWLLRIYGGRLTTTRKQ